jgi:hypothetical protein
LGNSFLCTTGKAKLPEAEAHANLGFVEPAFAVSSAQGLSREQIGGTLVKQLEDVIFDFFHFIFEILSGRKCSFVTFLV